jgi:hypothetical protein
LYGYGGGASDDDGWGSGLGLRSMSPELKSHKVCGFVERKFVTVVAFSCLSSTYFPTATAWQAEPKSGSLPIESLNRGTEHESC